MRRRDQCFRRWLLPPRPECILVLAGTTRRLPPISVDLAERGYCRSTHLRAAAAVGSARWTTPAHQPWLGSWQDEPQSSVEHVPKAKGRAAERVPLSGAARGRLGGDISVPLLGVDYRVEVKRRADGFRAIYKWLNGADLLIIRADRSEPLVVVPLKFAAKIAALAERAHAEHERRELAHEMHVAETKEALFVEE